MTEKLNYYRRKGYKEVEGHILPYMIKCVCDLSEVQKEHGIKGNMCEIGVLQGRFFILLHLLAENDEYSIACDLFERQNENIGLSGQGNKEMLLKNLEMCGADMQRVDIITKNSLNLSKEELLAHGQIRMFSVDGGHEAGTAYNDIKLAAETLTDGGIIWLDDFPHENCPGVMEAMYSFFSNPDEKDLWPVAMMQRKLILTNNEKMARIYMKKIFESLSSEYEIGNSIMVGKRVLIMWEKSPRRKLKKYLQQNKLWKRMKKYRVVDEIGKVFERYL